MTSDREGESTRTTADASPVPGPLPLPGWVPPVIYAFVAVAAVALLIAHTFSCGDCITVDTTSLGLLAILILLPLAPYITRLRAGEVEAIIGRQEAQHLQRSASNLPSAAPEAVEVAALTPSEAPTVLELIERDPPLGLAKLRMDLEQEIRRIYTARVPDRATRGLSLGMMIRELTAADVLPQEVAAPLQDVLGLANRAVHGDYVPSEVAEDIANVGLRVLAALRESETERR